MNNQDIYAQGFHAGWEACRRSLCERYDMSLQQTINEEQGETDELYRL